MSFSQNNKNRVRAASKKSVDSDLQKNEINAFRIV